MTEGRPLHELELTEAAGLVRTKKVSPVELTRACLARVEKLNPVLNAFITVTAEPALEQASKAEQEIQRGGWRGPLHGMPIALKDLIDTAGVRTTAASALFQERVPQQDAEVVRRLKAAGAVFLLDIHYSDTWADPQHQEIPVAWRGLSFDSLLTQVEAYSRETIKALKDAGAMPDWVQVGNEITRGTLWPLGQLAIPGNGQYLPPQPSDSVTQWDHLTRILKAGIRGVMEGAGNTPPRIAIHIDRGGDRAATRWFFDHLEAAHVPYDIIAESFYPEWRHGTLDQLWGNMNECWQRYHKDFLVAETGYGESHLADNPDMMWPLTPQGRLQFMVDLINTVKKAPGGIGAMYWEPEWEAWNQDGSPGPVVFSLDSLGLTAGPGSHAPAAVRSQE